MTVPRIILNNLLFHLGNTAVTFDRLNLSFEPLKYGIVGDNGGRDISGKYWD
ncbi:MAG: hypothetical protein K0U12_02935 [Gammaproteobacteria bacterium]|nr:hypothetical protein [Gammaproteobacteria bacterium]